LTAKHKINNQSDASGTISVKNVTKLPDHDKKANLNDLTMGEKDLNDNES
jgi:hypothetical protein